MRIAQRKESPIIGLTGMGGGLASYILYGGSGSSVYEISRSLRFNSADSAYLSKTSNPDPDGNRKQWTWSGWVKRSSLGTYQYIWGNANSGAEYGFMLRFENNDTLRISDFSTSAVWAKVTSAVFRDVSAWYHIVVSYDTTNTTAADRVKLYVNGSRITEFTTDGNPDEMYSGYTNDGSPDRIGRWGEQAAYYLNGYLADLHFVDGGALTADDFGETDQYGIWNPKEFTGDHNVTNTPSSYPAVYVTSKPTYGTVANVNTGDGAFTSTSGLSSGSVKVVFESAIENVTHVRFQGGGYSLNAYFDVKINGTTVLSNLQTSSSYASRDEALGGTYNITSFEIVSASDGWALFNLQFSTDNVTYTYPSGTPSIAEKSGLNGWHLKFDDNTSTTTLGADSSGNSNDWTLNSFSVASGSGNDSLLDSPTNYSASSGNNGGNYATLNPLHGRLTLSNGNLDSTSPADWKGSAGTIGMTSGKWYWEIDNVVGNEHVVGIVKEDVDNITWNNTYGYGAETGVKYLATSGVAYGDAWTTGDVIGVAFDADVGTLTFYKDGVSQGIAAYGLLNGPYLPSVVHNGNTRSSSINFGQRPWTHTPPTDHVALCTQNLPDPPIEQPSEYVGVSTWTGTNIAAANTITGLGFSPDLIWSKSTSHAYSHQLVDTTRGGNEALKSDSDFAQVTDEQYGYIDTFNSDGFTSTPGSSDNDYYNGLGKKYVAWTWDAGSNSNRTYNVTVVSDSGNKYRLNGNDTSAATLELEEGSTYVFDSSDSSVDSHPFVLGTSANSGEYSTGVTYTLDGVEKTYSQYTSGFASATTRKLTITVPASAPTLYYWCSVHSGMGGQINTNSTAGSSVLSGSLNSSYYNTDAHWSLSSSIATAGNVFDGSLSTSGTVNSSGSAVTVTTSSFSARRIRFYKNGNDDANLTKITINSTDYFFPVQSASTGWQEVDLGSTITVTSFTTTWYGNYTIYAIEVDGKLLTDSTVTPTSVPLVDTVVRANQTAGFSMVRWTGNSNNQTVAHGLSGEPSFILMKDLDNNAYWRVYHNGGDFTTGSGGAYSPFYHWRLDETNTRIGTAADAFTNTRPTNTHFTVAANANTGSTDGMLAYCWQQIEGYSKFGNYTGNTTTLPFVYTGFRPRWLLLRRADGGGTGYDWHMYDSERDPHNRMSKFLGANTNQVEQVRSDTANYTDMYIDFLSNGFKLRNTYSSPNNNTGLFIYAAFAEHPFKNVRAR